MPTRLFLRRFEIETTKLVGSSPPFFLYPAEGTVAFYQQGATVARPTSINAGTSELVPVRHPGAIRKPKQEPSPAIYDFVQAYVSGYFTLKVLDIIPALPRHSPNTVQLMLENTSGQNLVLPLAARLILASRAARLYDDPFGNILHSGNTINTDPVTGRGSIYVGERVFDYVVSGNELLTRAGIDVEGSYDMRGR